MKPNHKRSHMMSASFVRHQNPSPRCVSVISPFLRRLNMGTVALIMFVGFALLSTTRGKEAETRQPASVETTRSEVSIGKQHDNAPNIVIKAAGQKMLPPVTLSQFIGR